MTMRIKMLVGIAHESYPRQNAPEVIVAVDEWVLDDNPEFWEKEKARALADNYADNFMAIGEVDIEVDQEELRQAVIDAPKLKARVLKENT